MLSLSLRQIEYAVTVMEYGSVSSAAMAINISQPALSVAIARIEAHFGKALFIRRKGASVVPTSFGVSFLSDANVLLDQFEKLINTDGENYKQKKPIVIGCFTDLAPLILAPIIVQINEMFPNLNIITSVDDFESLSAKLKDGLIDFAITYNLGFDAEFERKKIITLKPKVLVGQGHHFHNKTKVSLKEVSEENLVLADQSLSISHMMSLFKQNDLEPIIAYKVETLELMRSFVANDLGVGLSYTIPETDRSYDGKILKVLDIDDISNGEPIVIATNRNNPVSRKTLEIIETIISLYKIN